MEKSAVLHTKFAKIPEHIRSMGCFSGAYPFTSLQRGVAAARRAQIPEHIRSFLICNLRIFKIFRCISVHIWGIFRLMGKEPLIPVKRLMAGKTISMASFKQAILLKLKQNMSNRRIADELGMNKETVNIKFAFIRDNGLSMQELLKLDDPELEKVFHSGHSAQTDERHSRFLELLDYFREQLQDKHVTRYLLWEEYIKANPGGYSKSQFYHHLKQNLKIAKVTTVLTDTYQPGLYLFIDYAGDTWDIVDPHTGEVTEVQVFVACLPFSGYTFAYAVPSQRVEDFVHAIAKCLEHLGGVPQIVRLDNLKSGVIKYHKHEPDFNKALQDMGNHYHFVAQACRPKKPTDKALVESGVRRVYNRVYAPLRHQTYHSIEELNAALEKRTLAHNQTRMQRHPYSRQERFVASEKDELQPLPEKPFEVIYTAQVTVQMNCHVLLSRDNHFYSVSHVYVGKKALMRYTRSIVKIYIDNNLVATHQRCHDRFQMYVTDESHLASNSRYVRDRNVASFCERAAKMTPGLGKYIQAVFDDGVAHGFAVECRYNTCQGIIANSRKYPASTVEQACSIAIDKGIYSSRKFEHILKTTHALDQACRSALQQNPTPTGGENLRGRQIFV